MRDVERYQAVLAGLLAEDENKFCADCQAKGSADGRRGLPSPRRSGCSPSVLPPPAPPLGALRCRRCPEARTGSGIRWGAPGDNGAAPAVTGVARGQRLKQRGVWGEKTVGPRAGWAWGQRTGGFWGDKSVVFGGKNSVVWEGGKAGLGGEKQGGFWGKSSVVWEGEQAVFGGDKRGGFGARIGWFWSKERRGLGAHQGGFGGKTTVVFGGKPPGFGCSTAGLGAGGTGGSCGSRCLWKPRGDREGSAPDLPVGIPGSTPGWVRASPERGGRGSWESPGCGIEGIPAGESHPVTWGWNVTCPGCWRDREGAVTSPWDHGPLQESQIFILCFLSHLVFPSHEESVASSSLQVSKAKLGR